MPELGEIRKACEIGKKGWGQYIWVSCPVCNKCRWVQSVRGEPRSSIVCPSCCRLHKKPPKNAYQKGSIPWNKGLTKESDSRVMSSSRTLSVVLTNSYTPEKLEQLSNTMKKYWLTVSPEKKEVWLRNFIEAGSIAAAQWRQKHPEPNKVELELGNLLNDIYPNRYVYCGNGNVKIGNLYPDFININGKKKVIEMFGDYWHSWEVIKDHWEYSEIGKMYIYNSYGFDCLVIWEHELKDKDKVIQRVKAFEEDK